MCNALNIYLFVLLSVDSQKISTFVRDMKKYMFLLLLWANLLPAMAQDNITNGDSVAVTPTDTIPALPWPQSLQADLDSLIAVTKLLDVSEMGLMVYDLTADSAIYQYHQRHTLRPASTMKLLTAIATLDRLGGSYQFRTSLYHTGVVDSCTLKGDLYCLGGMDPRFNGDDLNAFVEGVKRLGVDSICGSIVTDKSMKDADLLGWGWCWDDENPVLSPLLVSEKDNFAERFLKALQKAGIKVSSVEPKEGKVPNGSHIVCSRFHSMDQILMKMMKDSNNLYAESMFYQLAATQGVRPATAKQGRNAMSKLVERLGFSPSDYVFADGSGLSLYNYLSPELEVALLRYAWNNSNIRIHLYQSLPVAGQDGTLSKRMRRTVADGNVHAKTGTLRGVTALAGYCTAGNGHVLAFSIMNQGVMQINNGRDLQDSICILMCQP